MDLSVLKFIAMGIAIGVGVLGPGIGLGFATKAIIESIARQPEVEGQISKYFYIGAGLIEAKGLVEKCGVIKENVPKEEAEKMVEALKAAGATAVME